MNAAQSTAGEPKDFGRLANNGMAVKALQAALGRTETNFGVIPRLVSRVIKDDAWRHWIDETTEYTAKEFRAFLVGPKPGGCNTPLHVIERVLKDTDAHEAYCLAISDKPGGSNNPSPSQDPVSGKFKSDITVNTDSIRIDGEPTIIPIKTRDRSNDMPGGTSRIAALRRLSKSRPDLLEQVKSGELSAHKAMVVAGFAEKSITIPSDPANAARRLLRHFQDDRLRSLVEALANAAGFTLTSPNKR